MTTQTSTPLDITQTVAVIGAGAMGIGIAQVAATAGHPVTVYDNAPDAADNAVVKLKQRLSARVEKGKMTQADMDTLCQRITTTADINDLGNSALVVEAIIEDLSIKQSVFAQLESICATDAILASNTSSLSISAIASKLERPERVVGMHFFNPAPVLKLVEVVKGLLTSQDVADTVYATAAAWGKSPVHVKSSPGFIVNRVARPFYAEGLRSLNENTASVPTIDAVMRNAGGFKLGPFELTDLIGHDVNLAVTTSVYNAYYQDLRFQPSPIQAELVAAGLLGRKTGHGFYQYPVDAEDASTQASVASAQKAPAQCTFYGDLGIATPLIELAQQSGINVSVNTSSDTAYIEVDGVRLQLTDGRLASQCAQELNTPELVLFDLALDFEKASGIAIAPAAQASQNAIDTASGFLQALNKQVYIIKDVPGMLVMRTACMLGNEAADTVNQGVCNAQAVDIAMCGGVAYPIGPIAWVEKIGVSTVVNVLNHLANTYDEDRYRCSPLLQMANASGLSFEQLANNI